MLKISRGKKNLSVKNSQKFLKTFYINVHFNTMRNIAIITTEINIISPSLFLDIFNLQVKLEKMYTLQF